VGKSGVLEHKSGNISETRKDITMHAIAWRAYRNSPTLFRTAPGVLRDSRLSKIFRASIYRAHRTVIFAAAQLSCYSKFSIISIILIQKREAQLPQRNSASAAHVYLGWLTDRAMHRTPQNRRGCTISDIQTL